MQLSRDEMTWVQETLEKVKHKLEKVSKRSKDKIPYTAVGGVHDDKSGDGIGWWTNGFWGGMMWQMYMLTKEESYKEIAMENERKLDVCLMDYDKLDHDNGFKWLPTAVACYRITKGSLRQVIWQGVITAWENLYGHGTTGLAVTRIIEAGLLLTV